ncbi:MAG: glycosyltransferase family 39 protein, partial [Deltaproteobacteria bacterium]|nr:glycosyltransferase family 39 protein [Deltaproteobacteria bacterium]
MVLKQRQGLIEVTVTLVFVSVLLGVRLSAFGIWDPWELNLADAAQKLLSGKELSEPHGLSVWFVAFGFKAFGLQEWAGRVPIVVFAVVTVFLAYQLVGWFATQRAAVYAAVVTATCPLFLFNARPMMGETVAFSFQALVALCASAAVFKPCRNDKQMLATIGWLAALLISVMLAVETRGALLCALPPLAAVACVAALKGLLRHPKKRPAQALAGYVVATIATLLTGLITADILANQSEYSRWIGGVPK